MKDNLAAIVSSLRRIQEEGGNNSVIFTSATNENHYIQFAGDKGETRLYAEAVSNECLPPNLALDGWQIERLQSMGWKHPSQGGVPNFFRKWQATDDHDRLTIARKVMQAFVQVYGMAAQQPLDIHLVLDGAPVDSPPYGHPDAEASQYAIYPPRILAPGFSFWLTPNIDVELIRQNLVAYQKEGSCHIHQPPGATAEVRVNGQALTEPRILQDGDFIHSGTSRFIFQADPAADRRDRMESNPWPPKLDQRLSQHVRADATSLSLNGGKTSARWDEVISLFVTRPYGKRGLAVGVSTWDGQLQSTLIHLSFFAVRQLFRWLSAQVPFDLSIQGPRSGRLLPPDAYLSAARKLLYRVEAGQLTLPADRHFVLGEPSRFKQLRQSLVTVVGSVVGFLATAALIGKAIENQRASQLIDQTGALTIGGIIVAVMLGSLALASAVGVLYGLTQLVRTLMPPDG